MFILTHKNNIVNSSYIRSLYIAQNTENKNFGVFADINSSYNPEAIIFVSENREDCETYIKDLYKKLGKNGND